MSGIYVIDKVRSRMEKAKKYNIIELMYLTDLTTGNSMNWEIMYKALKELEKEGVIFKQQHLMGGTSWIKL